MRIAWVGGAWLLMCSLGMIANAYAWNDMGHCVIAQIAEHQLSDAAKQRIQPYQKAMSSHTRPMSFVSSATWLDKIKRQHIPWFNTLHYINIPFSLDGTVLPQVDQFNAVWAVEQAEKILANPKATWLDKGVSLRIMLHVVGDLHQPLHSATLVSSRHPDGDQGGNLLLLGKNPVAKNLHGYWDKAAGLLKPGCNRTAVMTMAQRIESQWPCTQVSVNTPPMVWAQESHQLAKEFAYQVADGAVPSKKYQDKAQLIATQRLAAAGCRLAVLLNR